MKRRLIAINALVLAALALAQTFWQSAIRVLTGLPDLVDSVSSAPGKR